MAWTDIPFSDVTFGLFVNSTPGASVTVAPGDFLLCRYKLLDNDTMVIDVRIGKAFFKPATASVSGITLALKLPLATPHFPALGSPNPFMDEGQSYSNDCMLALDPGGLNHAPGCLAVLNEPKPPITLLIRTVNGDNLNVSSVGVVGMFGQVTFEVKRA
ncbi:MAG TPA: hypothetical protein VIX35_10890 [Vicinamibacterales bacterium]